MTKSFFHTHRDRALQRPYAGTSAWSGEMLHDFARLRAARSPDAVALVLEDGTEARFGALWEEAQAVAAELDGMGLVVGDRVSFLLPNWREAAAIAIACSALGLTINPIIPIYRDAECAHILRDSGSKVVFAPGNWRGFDFLQMLERLGAEPGRSFHVVAVRAMSGGDNYQALVARGRARVAERGPVARHVDPDGPKMLLYTSGTTGPAKGVIHSHNSLSAARIAISRYWQLDDRDVMIMPSPITHVTGYMMGIEFPFFTGGRSLLMAKWDAARAVDLIDAHGATATVGATPFLAELLEAAASAGSGLPTMRLFACGGAAVPPELVRRAHQAWPNCRTFRIYGSSEAPGVTAGWMAAEDRNRAVETDGRVQGWDVRVDASAGADEGEIQVAGPGLFIGYVREDDMRSAMTPDGFFLTGDLGRLSEDGALTITGRKKDLIIRGGENLSPKEIEDVLHMHPRVREAAVVAMPHARLGEGICAYIVAVSEDDPPSRTELSSFVEQQGLARQKIPERYEFRQSLPKTASGKVRKDLLRDEASRLAVA